MKSPALWGTEARLRELFGEDVTIKATRRDFVFRYHSPEHWLDVFRTWYGPVNRAFAALDDARQAEFAKDLLELMRQGNRSDDATLVLPSEYLEVVITK
jgi:hypothetical protein